MGVQDRVALITGSGQGIGEGIARELAVKGAKVVINDINQERIDNIVSQINEEFGEGTALGIKADITDPDAVQNMVEETVGKFGKLDILVNNAGIARDKTIRGIKYEDWNAVINTNLTASFLTCQAAAHKMINQEYGRIINISSRAWLGFKGQASYSASKGGLISLTRTLALELAKYKITSNAICPGLIRTQLFDDLPEDAKENLLKIQPTRSIGEPKDIAYGAAFLASDEASYITGQTLYIGGGKSLYSSLSV